MATQPSHGWGMCKDCKWWQIEPAQHPNEHTVGQCIEGRLQPFMLRVSGESGCNRFLPGKPATAAGASQAPSVALPTR
jgi:hypothetical protein